MRPRLRRRRKRPAAINPILGAERIARFFAGLHEKFGYRDTGPVELVRINRLLAYVTVEVGGVLQTTALEIADERIHAIYVVRNPDKLGHLAPVRTVPDMLEADPAPTSGL